VSYVAVPEEAARQAMGQAPEWMTDAMMELYGVARAGYSAVITPTVEQVVGRPPFTFEQFAQDYHHCFQPTT
jgi:hypothetical protein